MRFEVDHSNLIKKTMKCYNWNIALYGIETWMLWKTHQKWNWKFWNMVLEMGLEKISWNDHVRNGEVLTGLVTFCVGTAI